MAGAGRDRADVAPGFPHAWFDRPIADLFGEQVRRDPGALAVQGARGAVAYGVLAASAHRIAHAVLAARGPDSEPIALLFEHDAPVLAAILGVLEAGKAYVALDPHFADVRLTAILADSQAPLVIADAAHRERARALARPTGAPVLDAEELDAGRSADPVGLAVSPHAPGCIAYTSGSTGEAKGVVGDHRSISHRAMVLINTARVRPGDRLSLMESVGVGGSFRGVFGALLAGAATFPLDVRAAGAGAIAPWLARERVTICMTASSIFRHVAAALPEGRHFPDLRYIGVGREPVLQSDVELFRSRFSPGCVLVNVMGSAEAGTMRELVVGHPALPDEDLGPDAHVLPAGHAVADKEVLLLDDDGRPVPPGEIGEIVVRSAFLARGYWRRPDLDAAVFSPAAPGSPGRVCRTGDLGRMLRGELLMHLGRKDARAKLRGRFVDAAEIEAALMACAGVQAAAAIVREDRPGDQRLVAYVVPQKTAAGPALTPGDVLRAARARLDASLASSAVVFLDALPLAPNGKIDRRALPAPPATRVRSAGPPVAPRTRIEAEVLRVWADVLALDDIGVHEHFVELGGTSLVAGRIATLVSERFGVDLPARELLDAPTVADMAVVVTAHLLGRLDPDAAERGLAGGEASADG